MTPFDIGILSLFAMGGLAIGGLHVPIALILCSFIGVWAIKGNALLAAKMLGLAANDAISSYFFGVVPVFVLMGFIVSESGIEKRTDIEELSSLGVDAFLIGGALLQSDDPRGLLRELLGREEHPGSTKGRA